MLAGSKYGGSLKYTITVNGPFPVDPLNNKKTLNTVIYFENPCVYHYLSVIEDFILEISLLFHDSEALFDKREKINLPHVLK